MNRYYKVCLIQPASRGLLTAIPKVAPKAIAFDPAKLLEGSVVLSRERPILTKASKNKLEVKSRRLAFSIASHQPKIP